MILRKLNKMLIPLLVVAVTAGCIRDEYTPRAAVSEGRIKFSAKIPAQLTPATRAIGGFAESAITTIDLLVFDKDNKLVQHLAVPSDDIGEQSKVYNENFTVAFSADLADNADARTVVVVANAAREVLEVVNQGTDYSAYGKDKKTILNSLTFSWEGEWKTNYGYNGDDATDPPQTPGTDYTPIPMYGEEELLNGITSDLESTTIKVDMTRMLACIEVFCYTRDFIITDVYLVNSNANGYIAPAWDEETGEILSTLPDTPMIPDPSKKQKGKDNALEYKIYYDDDDDYKKTELGGEIYTFEALATPGSKDYDTHSESICLIVKGYYYKQQGGVTESRSWNQDIDNGKTYYYRIDFTDGVDANGIKPGYEGFDPSTVEYMPVYRNHLYEFTITHALSRGYETFDEALNSLGVMNNLRTELHVVDQSGITEIVYNGQYYLGLGTTDVLLENEIGNSVTIPVATNYPGGLEIEVPYDSWISASKEGNNIVVTALNYNTDLEDRQETIYIKAGRLIAYVNVSQFEHLLYAGRLSGELRDWNNDGVWSYSEELWMSQDSYHRVWGYPPYCWSNSKNKGGTIGLLNYGTTAEHGRNNTHTISQEMEWWEKINGSVPGPGICIYRNKNLKANSMEYNDINWFLPSQNELMAMWVTYESFPEGLGPNNTYNYLSSSESDAENAWATTFFNGETFPISKVVTGDNRVRCIRNTPTSY